MGLIINEQNKLHRCAPKSLHGQTNMYTFGKVDMFISLGALISVNIDSILELKGVTL